MTDPIYAIGDIHGQLGMLEDALALIEADGGPDAHVVFVGDYTDRGPDSRAVIDLLIAGRAEGRRWTTLKGNHDRMFEWFLEEQPRFDPHLFTDLSWLHPRLGGLTTLGSYGLDVSERTRLGDLHAQAREAVPEAHVAFLRDLEITHETDAAFFVHAGIRPLVPLARQTVNDMLWIRDGFLDHTDPHPKLIVHGHTALDAPRHFGNRVDLDGGAGYGRPLVPALFEGADAWLLTAAGRVPLRP